MPYSRIAKRTSQASGVSPTLRLDMRGFPAHPSRADDESSTNQNTTAYASIFCIKAMPIAPTLSPIARSEHTFIFRLLLVVFISFVSLVLKALPAKARSRVLDTDSWFSLEYLLTRVSIYTESHRQFKSQCDLLAIFI